MRRTGTDNALFCSFCRKSQDVVDKLISSPSDHPRAYICDECIAVCQSILDDDRVEGRTPPPRNAPPPPGATRLLIDAVRHWVSADAESEQPRLAKLREIAERMLIRPGLPAALDLPPGVELDVLVGSKIFGKTWMDPLPCSRDLAVAWLIVDHLTPLFDREITGKSAFHLGCGEEADHFGWSQEEPCETSWYQPHPPALWIAHFHVSGIKTDDSPWQSRAKFCARGNTPALAICRAGLKACW